jgi:hypothetical protein
LSTRRISIAARLTTILVLGTLLVACDDSSTVLNESASVLEYRHDGLLYTFHLTTGTEALFDTDADPDCLDNLLHSRREEAAHVRSELEKSLHVGSLEELRDEDSAVLQSLKGLGYI